jgi:hypothetical protein
MTHISTLANPFDGVCLDDAEADEEGYEADEFDGRLYAIIGEGYRWYQPCAHDE